MCINKIINFASLAGKIILENGGETYRAEETIVRMLENKVDNVETFVIPTGIFVSVEDNGKIYTKLNRIITRGTDLNKIAQVNNLSRQFSKEKIETLDLDKYIQNLQKINSIDKYDNKIKILAAGIAAANSMMVFGGNLHDFIPTFITAMLLQKFVIFLEHIGFTSFIVNCFGGAFVTIFSIIFSHWGKGSLDNIIIGSIMILVPGVAITNSLRDIIAGDLISGTAKGVDALISAIGIATGVGALLKIREIIGGLI